MDRPDFIRRPEYPLLVAGLIDQALGNDMLDTIQTVARVAYESRIQPLPIKKPTVINHVENHSIALDFTAYLIIAAILLLLWDGWLLRKKQLPPGKIVP